MDDGRTFTDRLAFLRAGDVVLADHLLRAAQLAHDDPASCAVALRCFAEHLVRQHLAAGTKRSKKALFEILIDLQQAGALPTGILNDLDSLRQVGNLGAHPEQQHQALGNMEEELRRGWRLAEWFHAWLGGRPEDVPSFEPPTPADGNSIYREAFLGGSDGRGDPVAKFHVAKAIRLQDERRLKEARVGGQPFIQLRTNEVRDLLRGVICDVPAARTELATLRLQKHEVTDDDRKEALELLTWAVEGDDPDGLFYLGAFYLQGDHGLGVDIGKAVGLLERAVGHEHPGAFNALAMLYRDGRGVEADPVLARRYAERSAEAGFPIGQYQLAGFLLEGIGGDADWEAGLLWLRRAVRQDWAEAKFHLAFLILEGYVEAGPGENPEALLEKACQERSVNALLWRADRELKKPDDQANFQRIFNDLIAAGECSDSPPGAVTQEKLSAAYLRLDRYLRRLPTSSIRRHDLSFLWFQFASDGTRKYTKDELVDLVTPFGREKNGGPNDADWQLNMIRAQSGPGVSEAEIRRRMAYLQAAKSAGGPALSNQEPAEIQRVGRNEPCPCGNGKKYKKCHGR